MPERCAWMLGMLMPLVRAGLILAPPADLAEVAVPRGVAIVAPRMGRVGLVTRGDV